MSKYESALKLAHQLRSDAERREAESLARIKAKLADPLVPEEEKARLRARIRNMSTRIKNGAATPTHAVAPKPEPNNGANANA